MNKNIIIAAVAAVAVCCIGYVVGRASVDPRSTPDTQCCPSSTQTITPSRY